MHREARIARATVIAMLFFAALAAPAGAAAAAGPDPYVVLYRPSVDSVAAQTQRLEDRANFNTDFRYSRATKGFAAELTPDQVAELRADPSVAAVTPDFPVHALGSPIASGEDVPPGVRRIGAATATAAHDASGVSVAVIDSGIDLSHPDLNAVDGKNCVTPGTAAQDDNGHGTHVAGTIGARNSGSGVVGVAPGTKLYAVKVLDATGSGNLSNVLCGIDWVRANAASLNIKVANMSLGGTRYAGTCSSDIYHQAICNATAAGINFAVAAGNSGWDFGLSPQDVPAAYPEVLTVTAMTDSDGQPGAAGGAPACRDGEGDDSYATYSNFATAAADAEHTIAAPGTCIRSTWPGGGYETLSGTSMAAPHVAGAIALCLGEGSTPGPCAGLSPAEVISKMRADAATGATASNGFAGDPSAPVGVEFGNLLRVPAPPPPSATTRGASGVAETGATISADLDAQGMPVTYHFEYGPTASYGNTTPEQSLTVLRGSQSVAAQLSGLAGSTQYHYRIVLSHTGRPTYGTDQTFTTLSPPPPPPANVPAPAPPAAASPPSSAPSPVAAVAAPKCKVPATSKKTLTAAKKALRAAKCKVGGQRWSYSRSVKKGRVIRTNPSAKQRTGKAITIYISRGRAR